jgi:tetratricopeptide (TPR) repeat protein
MNMANLGYTIWMRGAAREALPILTEALAVQRRVYAGGHTEIAYGLAYMAHCQQSLGNLDEASSLWDEVMPMRRRLLGDVNRSVAGDLAGYSELLRLQGDLSGAERSARDGIEIHRKTGEEIPASALLQLGRVRVDQEGHAEAEELFRRVLAMREKSYGPENARGTGEPMLLLAEVLHRQGKDQEAEPLFRKVLELRRTLPPNDWDLGAALFGLGAFLADRGEREAARPLLEQALAIRSEHRPPGHRSIEEARGALARLH